MVKKCENKKNNKYTTREKVLLVISIILALSLIIVIIVDFCSCEKCKDESSVNTLNSNNGNSNFEIEKKPVLYLYPKKETKINVTFEKPELLTTTYPKYKDGWEVTAKKNGDLTDKNGNYYYALYWEEKKHSKVDFSEGFYVTKDDAMTFLEDKLKYIGLNDKERNEFIMYWLPILESNKKSVVYFELTKERESFNKLRIDPKPDSMLRICIHVKKVKKKPDIKKQKLSSFNRKGFAAIEWGGVIHKASKK